MASDKKKFQKKKERERASRKKVLARRESVRKAKKEEAAKEEALEREYNQRSGTDPAKNQPYMKEETKEALIRQRLEHNIKILEALEQEYLAEQEKRNKANQELEADGHVSIREKMDALQAKALQKLEELGIDPSNPNSVGGMGGSADCKFKPYLPPDDEEPEISIVTP